ncbi:MAG: three-Cys-motif partner protein TcmP [Rhodospirillaceae bacterium]
MSPIPDSYKGREQSYVKHVILEEYLTALAYRALYAHGKFTFLDAFSGPWQSTDGTFEDTSFMKAIRILSRVQQDVRSHGKKANVRCIFVEKKKSSYKKLKAAVENVSALTTVPLHGEFENLMPEILENSKGGFLLAFIDPKGWTGFSFEKIQPILSREPNEVLITFMYEFIRRFLNYDNPKNQASLNALFGSKTWKQSLQKREFPEDTIVDRFAAALKEYGAFRYAISTPILKPTRDKTLYRLVFGTRHPKGIEVYRDAERKALRQQLEAREGAKLDHRVERSRQAELFGADALPLDEDFKKIVNDELEKAKAQVMVLLSARREMTYGELRQDVLLKCRVRLVELNEIVSSLRKERVIEVAPWLPKQRVPKTDNVIRLVG